MVGRDYEKIKEALPLKSCWQVRNFWMNHHHELQLKKLCPPGKYYNASSKDSTLNPSPNKKKSRRTVVDGDQKKKADRERKRQKRDRDRARLSNEPSVKIKIMDNREDFDEMLSHSDIAAD